MSWRFFISSYSLIYRDMFSPKSPAIRVCTTLHQSTHRHCRPSRSPILVAFVADRCRDQHLPHSEPESLLDASAGMAVGWRYRFR